MFLELDGSATLTLGLEAAAEGSVVTPLAAKREGMQIRGTTRPGHYYWSPPPVWNEKFPVESEASTTTSGYETMASQTTSGASYSTSTSSVSSAVESNAVTTITLTAMGHSMTTTAHEMKTSKAMKKSSIYKYTSTQTVAAPISTATGTNGGVDGSASFSGCVEIGAGFDVNAGADANFFGLFNPETKVSLFSKKFELFKVGYLLYGLVDINCLCCWSRNVLAVDLRHLP